MNLVNVTKGGLSDAVLKQPYNLVTTMTMTMTNTTTVTMMMMTTMTMMKMKMTKIMMKHRLFYDILKHAI